MVYMNRREVKMTKTQAIEELAKLDSAYTDKLREARFWAKEYRLAGTASKYVKASQKPVIEAHYNRACQDQDAIWEQMVALMETYDIDALSEVI
jgi:hypothetical protein